MFEFLGVRVVVDPKLLVLSERDLEMFFETMLTAYNAWLTGLDARDAEEGSPAYKAAKSDEQREIISFWQQYTALNDALKPIVRNLCETNAYIDFPD